MKKTLLVYGLGALLAVVVLILMINIMAADEPSVPTVSYELKDMSSLLPKLEGHWLNEQYYTALNTGKSPVQAMEGVYEVYFEIKKMNEAYEWLKIFNFHEGFSEIITGLSESAEFDSYRVQVKTDGNSEDKPAYLFGFAEQPEVNKITYFDGETSLNFVRINEPAENYANRVSLVGKYRDANGQIYEFTTDLKAIWPDQSFKYDLNIDPVFHKYDYFWVLDKDDQSSLMFFCFERKDNQLFIYRGQLVEDEFMEREEKPYLVLERVE